MARKQLLVALSDRFSSGQLLRELNALSGFTGEWDIVDDPSVAGKLRECNNASALDDGTLNAVGSDTVLLADLGSVSEIQLSLCAQQALPCIIMGDLEQYSASRAALADNPLVRFLPADSSASAVAFSARNLASVRASMRSYEERTTNPGTSFRNLLKALPDIVYVLDAGGHFVYLNDAVQSIGYLPESLIGKHFSEILHEDDKLKVSREAVLAKIRTQEVFPDTPPKLFDERRSGARMTRDLEVRLVHRTSGDIVYGSVNAYGEPVSDPVLSSLFHSEGPVTMGVIHDITVAHLYQKSLEENLAAKEVLLREIHHRVKNNLQVIASLAHLREMEVAEESARETLSGLIAQIKSMAMVHEALYQTENLQGVAARDYFERFARFMEQTYGHIGSPVVLKVIADDCLVEVETLSYMAMIANELIANAYKHAFPDKRPGTVTLAFVCGNDHYELVVSDDGIGIPPGDTEKSGLGHEIVDALARQLGGKIERSQEGGTVVKLIMPLV